jgi:hypothetical protein
VTKTPSPGQGLGWLAAGVFLLIVGLTWAVVAERQFRFWLCAGHYTDAELEVIRFYAKPRNSQAPCQIEGVIHPGGERIVTTDRDLLIQQFNGPADRTGHQPVDGELDGKRLAISFWHQRPGDERWWHPPPIISRGGFARTPAVIRDLLVSAALLIPGIAWLRRGGRILKTAMKTIPVNG